MRGKSFCFAVLISAILTVATAFGQTTFPGSGFGPIPDSPGGCQVPGTPLNITFNVTGIATAPSNISVTMAFNPTHSYGGDIVARLISPDGTNFVLFGTTGATTATSGGDGSDLTGPYTFSNDAAGDWWAAALATATTSPIPSGSYRTSQAGGAGSTGALTDLNAAFASIPTSNGTWTLRFTDGCAGDTGSVSAASLTLTGGASSTTQAPNVDMDGDGKTDFVIVRDGSASPTNVGGSRIMGGVYTGRERMKMRAEGAFRKNSPAEENLQWWALSAGSNNVTSATLGDVTTDAIVSGDFDGDGSDDIAVYRSTGEPATTGFYWIDSGTSTFQFDVFGQEGDDPSVIGDYDGDGIDDRAVYRCPSGSAGTCYFYYRSSMSPSGFYNIPWGLGVVGDFFPCVADYTGDGKVDACIQRADPNSPSYSQFVYRSSDDGSDHYVDWGSPSDIIVPGDYDGDGKSDFCVRRSDGTYYNYYILTQSGNFLSVAWGGPGDVDVPGDYNGDGKQDIAIWRPSNGYYWVYSLSDGAITAQLWGLSNDYPVQNWNVH